MSSKFKDDRFLARWLNNELSPEEMSEFQNSSDYAAYKKIVAGAEILESPSFDQEALLAKIKSQQQGRLIATKRKVNYLKYAAAAAVLIVASLIFYTMLIPDITIIQTQIGEQQTIELPDGSEVVLNANSSIAFREDAWSESRKLELKGEAYFKVKEGITFSVETATGIVTVLGTQFTVRDVSDFFEVKCYEGSVKVESGEEDEILKPKRSVRRVGRNRMILREIKGLSPEWLQGRTTFESVPVSQVFAALKNHYDVQFEGAKIDQGRMYSGTFPNNNLDLALKVVFASLELDYQLKDNGIVVIVD